MIEGKEDLMRWIRSFLAAAIALSLVAGCGIVQTKNTVSAASGKKTFHVRAASEYSLKLPASWKNNYVLKKSRDEEYGSFLSFYAKKCYQQTKEGWLFSIMRYKDDSYMDIPSYELVGRWNGMNYVAVFPTDIQTIGATKTAKKQYRKLYMDSLWAAASIQPAKKAGKGKNVYVAPAFSLKFPSGWKDNYIVKRSGKKNKNLSVSFYAKKCYKQTKEGWLFSIKEFLDESYQELPAYELAGRWNGISYVAVFPTDVQTQGATKAAGKQYQKLSKSVEKVVRSIRR